MPRLTLANRLSVATGSQGSAGVVVLAVMGLTIVVCLSLVTGISLLSRVARVQATVDSMALEAADTASGRLPGIPCDMAAERVLEVGARLISCDVDEDDSRVDVAMTTGVLSFRIRAHAGPPRPEN